MNCRALGALTVLIGLALPAPQAFAQDKVAGQVSPAEISELKTQLAEQQKQIEQLRAMLEEQKKLLESKVSEHVQPYNLGQVASAAPVVPLAPSIAAPRLGALPAVLPPPQAPQKSLDDQPSPLQLKIGAATITPVGFMDL